MNPLSRSRLSGIAVLLGPTHPAAISQFCEEDPDECVATYERFQLAAIDRCEEYPEECRQAFAAWVASMDKPEESGSANRTCQGVGHV